jgi:hypothetical protein
MPGSTSTKVFGDAAEHYALSQFSFAGRFAAKMPDNWKGYDLVVAEDGGRLARVSVKLRTETERWSLGKWFLFDGDDKRICDWLVLIFKPNSGPLESWVIPFDVALREAAKPGENAKPRQLDLKWSQLQKPPLMDYKNNWLLRL